MDIGEIFLYIWTGAKGNAVDTQKMKKSLVICWQIWVHRNEVIHNKQQPNMENLKKRILKYIEEFIHQDEDYLKTACNRRVDGATVDPAPSDAQWIPPPEGIYKMSCDATWNERKKARRDRMDLTRLEWVTCASWSRECSFQMEDQVVGSSLYSRRSSRDAVGFSKISDRI